MGAGVEKATAVVGLLEPWLPPSAACERAAPPEGTSDGWRLESPRPPAHSSSTTEVASGTAENGTAMSSAAFHRVWIALGAPQRRQLVIVSVLVDVHDHGALGRNGAP